MSKVSNDSKHSNHKHSNHKYSNHKHSKAENKKVVRWAFLMSSGTFISRVLGLFRDIVIASFFSKTETDAFFVAFRIPNFFRRFLGEGALSISFIPVFVQYLSGSDKEQAQQRAKNLTNSVYTILLVFVSILTVLGIIFMDSILLSLFSGTAFAEVEGKMQMAITMAKILFVYFFLVTFYAYFMGIAQALGSFFIPALAPAFLNIFMIAFSFLPKDLVAFPPLLLCWGILVGGVLQVALTALVLLRLGFLPRLSLFVSVKSLKLIGSRFVPGIFGVGGFAIIGLLNLYFSGWLEEGTHSYIYYGDRLLELPRSLIAVSLGTALLPGLSQFFALGQKENLLKTAADQRDILLFLILPCALGFYYLGVPIIEVLFQRGQFDALATKKTAIVLKFYAFLLVTSSVSRILATCFYAVQNTWYPALCTSLYVLFHWLITPYLVKNFGLEGLLGASVISNVFFMFLLVFAYPFFLGKFYLWSTIKRVLHFFPVLLALSFYLYISFDVSLNIFEILIPNKLAAIFALLFVCLSSMVLYLSVGFLLRVPQAMECMVFIKNKMRK